MQHITLEGPQEPILSPDLRNNIPEGSFIVVYANDIVAVTMARNTVET